MHLLRNSGIELPIISPETPLLYRSSLHNATRRATTPTLTRHVELDTPWFSGNSLAACLKIVGREHQRLADVTQIPNVPFTWGLYPRDHTDVVAPDKKLDRRIPAGYVLCAIVDRIIPVVNPDIEAVAREKAQLNESIGHYFADTPRHHLYLNNVNTGNDKNEGQYMYGVRALDATVDDDVADLLAQAQKWFVDIEPRMGRKL